jgi:hypothetical protein
MLSLLLAVSLAAVLAQPQFMPNVQLLGSSYNVARADPHALAENDPGFSRLPHSCSTLRGLLGPTALLSCVQVCLQFVAAGRRLSGRTVDDAARNGG